MILVKSFNGKSILLVLAYLSMSTVATSHKNPRLFIDKRMIFRFYCHSSTFTYILGTYFKERYTLIKFNIVYMLYHVIYPSKVSDLIDFYDDKVIYLFLYYTIHLFFYIPMYLSIRISLFNNLAQVLDVQVSPVVAVCRRLRCSRQ